MIQRDVEVRDTVLGVDYFSDVYNLKGPQYFEENALGAFLYSANAISDLNDHVQKAFNQYMRNEEKGRKLMTMEQIFDRLISFFPHLLIDVYDFLVKKGLPIDNGATVIGSVGKYLRPLVKPPLSYPALRIGLVCLGDPVCQGHVTSSSGLGS
ncbi:uncharacterized protein Pyn_10726 [Prunus yedoensis var. nudiflora]|uniref:Uncharacterized protein n=1 Tax=Prunus yedoensis var. nudiflora TaxID=2094558 RepID=A0A314Y0W0_PRUYE|nr:uncharacterized protein Pyn_10726 [Prunus yedoensis var. nudiflora]